MEETATAPGFTPSAFGEAFAKEFPELTQDSARIARGEEPATEMWARTSRIFQELCDANPSLKETAGPELELAMWRAARRARLEMFCLSKEVEIELDLRIGPGWRKYNAEMFRLLSTYHIALERFGRGTQELTDLMELAYWGARYGTFSQVHKPTTGSLQ